MDDINFKTIRYAFSVGFRHSFENRLAYRISLHQGFYASTDVGTRYDHRGYKSTSNILEISALGEFNLIQNHIKKNAFRLYLYGGGGLAYAFINQTGNPTRTPAISETRAFAPVLPFGFGFETWLNSNLSLGLEMGWQYTFSDFMDGIGTKDFNSQNDILANISLTASYKLSGSIGYSRNDCNCTW